MVTTVVLETTKGEITLEVREDWSPLGAARFLELIEAHFYDGAPWFRVIEGFVAQCGIAADPELNGLWGDKTIPDDPVIQGNQPGHLAFGKTSQPHSRSTHIFINLADNSAGLDPQGFACFARIANGLDIAQQLHRCEWSDQAGLAAPDGLARFKAAHPQADYILKAYVKQPESV